MEQTFLTYVGTDLRFWSSSIVALLRSIAVPASVMALASWFAVGPASVVPIAMAVLIFAMVDWALLIARMARRIALGIEQPNDLLDRSVIENASYLYHAYYVGRMPQLRRARG